ncbi:MAG: site-2 protease family protein [Solirubrobacteraceae bacterium]
MRPFHSTMLRRSTSIKLFDAFGIRIGVDRSWFLILFLMIFVLSAPFRDTLHSSDGVGYATTVISVLLLFGSLIVHELGHALVARRQGIEVKKIDLFLFGGLTQMSRDAASPGEDFKVAIAGPVATFAVILLCLAIDLPIVGASRLGHAVVLDSSIRITPVLLSLSWLLLMNVLLLAFNLLPAFPLDGGRVARSIVWRVTGDKRRGTTVAARLGQGLALLMGGLGLWWITSAATFGGLWLMALGWLLWQSCRGALMQSAIAERMEGVRVADIMDTHPVAIPADTLVTLAVDEYFGRYRQPWLPVIDEDGRLLGIVRQEHLRASIDAGEAWLTTSAVMEPGEAPSWRVRDDRPITELLASESLGQLGALPAVDADGILRGVVTIDQVRRAMHSAYSPSMPA